MEPAHRDESLTNAVALPEKTRHGIAVFWTIPAFRPTEDLPLPRRAAPRVVLSLRCVKQDGLRGCPALVPRGGFRGGGLFVQVSEGLFESLPHEVQGITPSSFLSPPNGLPLIFPGTAHRRHSHYVDSTTAFVKFSAA